MKDVGGHRRSGSRSGAASGFSYTAATSPLDINFWGNNNSVLPSFQLNGLPDIAAEARLKLDIGAGAGDGVGVQPVPHRKPPGLTSSSSEE